MWYVWLHQGLPWQPAQREVTSLEPARVNTQWAKARAPGGEINAHRCHVETKKVLTAFYIHRHRHAPANAPIHSAPSPQSIGND